MSVICYSPNTKEKTIRHIWREQNGRKTISSKKQVAKNKPLVLVSGVTVLEITVINNSFYNNNKLKIHLNV